MIAMWVSLAGLCRKQHGLKTAGRVRATACRPSFCLAFVRWGDAARFQPVSSSRGYPSVRQASCLGLYAESHSQWENFQQDELS